MNLHKHQLYLFEQHSESFNIWLAILRINTEGKSLIMIMYTFTLNDRSYLYIIWLSYSFL